MPIHAFTRTIYHPVACFIEGAYLQIAKAQGGRSVGGKSYCSFVGNHNLVPIHHICRDESKAQVSVLDVTVLEKAGLVPGVIGLGVVDVGCWRKDIGCHEISSIAFAVGGTSSNLHQINTGSHVIDDHCIATASHIDVFISIDGIKRYAVDANSINGNRRDCNLTVHLHVDEIRNLCLGVMVLARCVTVECVGSCCSALPILRHCP